VASWGSRVLTATNAALVAWRRSYFDPEQVTGGQYIYSRAAEFRLLWSYYDNSAFEQLAQWQGYKKTYSLYRQTRSLYNPVRRLVDFYAAQVYPGVLSEDGTKLPEGIPLAIPLAEDTPTQLKAAIAQFWQWSNWQSGKAIMVRYGAATGSVLVEIVDDLVREKVTANIVWPGLVRKLTLDATGNVKAYTIEYRAYDIEDALPYTYRKTVDAEFIQQWRDGTPWAPDDGDPVVPNPYGFVPAVWVKHRDLGGDHGAPAIHGSLGKIDEMNSLASHIHDQIHKVIGAPIVLWSEGGIANLFGQPKRGDTAEFAVPEADRESLLMLKGPAGGHAESLAGALDLGQALPYLDKLLGEIESDYPELALFRDLRQMSQVTGPAAARLMGDVGGNVWEAAANYDNASIKIFQMAVAISGWRVQNGDWGTPSRQQAKFSGFNLESYAKGDLDIAITVRPLIPVTKLEQIAIDRQNLLLEADKAAFGGDTAAIAQRLTAAAATAAIRPGNPETGALGKA
jgi:hypothetical protein